MSELQVFNSTEFGSILTVLVNNIPFFVGKDITDILCYTNASKAIADHVDEEDKLNNESLSSLGQLGGWLVNESGLYSLILSSKMPAARKFKRWVTSEVLPALRRHGLYATDMLLNDPDLAIAAFTALKEEREKTKKLSEMVGIQQQQITEMKPKVSYYDVVLNCKDLISTSAIAKDYGKSAIWMNRYLHEKGIQFKQGDIWLLYQKYAEKGYTSTKTHSYPGTNGEMHTRPHTYWTQKGRLFIYDLMKSDGILPTIEMEVVQCY